LELDVSPPAEVWWRGRLLGRAPGHLALPPGTQELELLNPELGARRRVRVTVPGTTRATLAKGELELRVSPWAYVTIDGRPLGASPVPAQSLWEGPHQVRFERPERGYRAELTVLIAPGKRELVRHVVPDGP
jgi:serine/threonine-protein kinase